MLIGAVFVGALLFVTLLKLQHARFVFRWIWNPADPSLRRLMVFSALPALGVATWFSMQGLYPPAALVLGFLLGLGILIASAGVLGMERALIEPESEAIARKIAGAAPATSVLGRTVAILAGSGLTGAALGVIAWMR